MITHKLSMGKHRRPRDERTLRQAASEAQGRSLGNRKKKISLKPDAFPQKPDTSSAQDRG